MNVSKLKIRSKFNLLMIVVVVFLGTVIGIITNSQIKTEMRKVFEDRVAVESNLGLTLLDEKYPGDWNVKDGELYKGYVKLNDNNNILEKFGSMTDGIANIFLGNYTVATNIVVNGERRIGADADSSIAEAVLDRGEVYIGNADISGTPYATMYQPIRDGSDKIIGMWLVGSPVNAINETANSVILTILAVIALTGIIAIIFTIFFTRSIVRPINEMNEQLTDIASGEGDLTKEIFIKAQDEVGDMATAFNKMLGTLRAMLNQVNATSEQVAVSSEQLLASSEQNAAATNQVVLSIQEIASSVEIQGHNTEESAAAIREVTIGIQQIADAISALADAANVTVEQAEVGNENIHKVISQMNQVYHAATSTNEVIKKLEVQSIEIGKIIGVITNIAEQTNLLSLNAAIEAARAGEAGKGFAVVAEEVGKLAKQSKASASQIVEIIKLIQSDTLKAVEITTNGNMIAAEGLQLTEVAGESFGQIFHAVGGVGASIEELSSISEQMSASMQQVNASIEEIASLAKSSSSNSAEIATASEEQLATVEEVTSAASSLANLSEQLRLLVNRFKI